MSASTHTPNPAAPHGPLVELNPTEQRRYSISRAVLAALDYLNPGSKEAGNCFELEVHHEIERHLSIDIKRNGGLFIPTYFTRAGLDTKTATKGAEVVFTSPGQFIEALRKKALVLSLGARLLPGLRDNIASPKQTAAATTNWVSDNPGTDVTATSLALGSVNLSAHLLHGSTSFSRQLLRQSTPAVDALVADDFAAVNALALDLAAVHGSGASNQPEGIYSHAGVAAVAFGGQITHSKLVEMQSTVAVADAETDVLTAGYLTTPEVRATAQKTPKFAGGSVAIWEDDRMNGQRAAATNQVSKTLGAGSDEHGIVYGIWSALMVGEWGVMELVVDPYTQKKNGMIEVDSFYLCDVNLRHAESFCKGTGLQP